MESTSHTLPSVSQYPTTLGGCLAFSSLTLQPHTNGCVSLPLSPISFPPSPTSLSPHSSSPPSLCTESHASEGQRAQVLSQDATPDQDDLTCLSWLHQRNNLLPLQPLAKMTPLRQRDGCTTTVPSPPPPPPPPPASSKPPYSFSSLIFMAIEDSPHKKLPVKDIYEWIVKNFPYYRTASGGWRNSVRHNLSLSKSFRRIQRDRTQSVGKGSFWCVCPEYRPALLKVLRKTHSFHSTSSNLINKPALLEGADYDVPAVCDMVEISDSLSQTLLLSSSSSQILTTDNPDFAENQPDHEELVPMESDEYQQEEVSSEMEKDPLSDSGYIELHYYQSNEFQYFVLPGDSELDLETVEILQLDAEAQEAAGSLLDLAGGGY
ncbi:Forkhead box protein N3 [Oryzias melastigma]|uniref:Forkhead box protein N3 n=1 Tax=Oryzias melastigma TaxID=30732 RepID=A0A834CGT9_ORYME|nr:Forkhead box protein N3 [Oryzias melastigma]